MHRGGAVANTWMKFGTANAVTDMGISTQGTSITKDQTFSQGQRPRYFIGSVKIPFIIPERSAHITPTNRAEAVICIIFPNSRGSLCGNVFSPFYHPHLHGHSSSVHKTLRTSGHRLHQLHNQHCSSGKMEWIFDRKSHNLLYGLSLPVKALIPVSSVGVRKMRPGPL